MNELNNSNVRMKSYDDVTNQLARMQKIHYPGANRWMEKARQIAEFYTDNITRQFELENEFTEYAHIKRSYAVRSFMYDTPREVIRSLKPFKKNGLYIVEDDGSKTTPSSIYFGIDTRLFRKDGVACGGAYFHYKCALYPVFLPDGTRYREPRFANVSCRYKNGELYDFYRE